MIPILSDKEIEEVVEAAFAKDALLEHYVATRGHWKRIAPVIAKAQRLADLRWFVEWLEDTIDWYAYGHDTIAWSKFQELKDKLAELEG